MFPDSLTYYPLLSTVSKNANRRIVFSKQLLYTNQKKQKSQTVKLSW